MSEKKAEKKTEEVSPALYSVNQREADARQTKETIQFLEGSYLLPYAADEERQSISIMLADEALRLEAISIFTAQDFYIPAYRQTFEAIVTLVERSESVSTISVASVLQSKGFLNNIGGVAGLASIQSERIYLASKKDLQDFAKRLRSLSVKRKIFEQCRAVAEMCFDHNKTGDSILAQADENFSEIRSSSVIETSMLTYKQVAQETRDELERWRRGVETSLKTGIPEIDARLWARGLARSEMYFFAALSSFGKTALVWQILNHLETIGKRGLFFTMEMSAVKLILRTIQRMSKGLEISPYTILKIEDPKSEKAQRRAEENERTFQRATELLKKIELWRGLVDAKTRNWSFMKAKIKQAHAEEPLDYIGGDYIQMVRNFDSRTEKRRDLEIARVSSESKEICEMLNVPWLWISQLNRGNKLGIRPEFSDLKESSYLEQDADFIGFIYGKAKMKDLTRKLNFYAPKQRNGRAGWEIPIDFVTNEQIFITEQMLLMMDNQNTSSDDLNEFEQTALLDEYKRQYAEEQEAEEVEEIEEDEIKF